MPTMPNCVGLKYEAALLAMVTAGVRVLPLAYFQVDPVSVDWIPTGAPSGFVVSQNPQPAQSVTANSAVVLTVSSYSVAVSSDGAFVSSQIPGDAMFDGPGSIFVLDGSALK